MLATLRVQGDHRLSRLARFLGRSPVTADALPWFLGALGERQMADGPLSSLPPGWIVLHSVGIGTRGSDIDHVLIGPAGVVTVNTKAHRGAKIWVAGRTFMVNGQRHPYIRNSTYEAARVQRSLARTPYADVPVTPVIAVVGAAQITRRDATEVAVVAERGFLRWLRRLPRAPAIDVHASLSGEVTVERVLQASPDTAHQTVREFAEQVALLSIWAPSELDADSTGHPADRADVERRFTELQRSWSRARTARRGWALVMVLGLLAAIPLAFQLLSVLARSALSL